MQRPSIPAYIAPLQVKNEPKTSIAIHAIPIAMQLASTGKHALAVFELRAKHVVHELVIQKVKSTYGEILHETTDLLDITDIADIAEVVEVLERINAVKMVYDESENK